MSDSIHQLASPNNEQAPMASQLLAAVQDVMARIRAMHGQLAEHPDDAGEAEAELLALIARREELAAEVGTSIVQWLAAGGTVSLVAPIDIVNAAREVPLQVLDDALEPDPEDVDQLEEVGAVPDRGLGVEHQEPDDGQPEAGDGSDDLEVVEAEVIEPPDTGEAGNAGQRDETDAPNVEDAKLILPVPERTPVSMASLQALAERGMSPNWSVDHTVANQQRALRRILREIGQPTKPRTKNQIRTLVERLHHGAADMDAWLDQSEDTQKSLMGLVSSLARHLQDEQRRPLDSSYGTTLSTLFSLMTRWSGEHRPGFVAGLSRSNDPESESWLSDARTWWDRLQRDAHPAGEEPQSPGALLRDLEERIEEKQPDKRALLAMVRDVVKAGVSQSDQRLIALLVPHRERFKGVKGLKTLKSQLRQAQREATEPQPADPTDGQADDLLPSDWPLFEGTRGKAALIVGGDDRAHAAARIQATFGFSRLEWETGHTRRAGPLAERIRRGRSVDVVILLREFVSHRFPDVLVPACREAGIHFVCVDKGYGVTQVRLALERFLGGPSSK